MTETPTHPFAQKFAVIMASLRAAVCYFTGPPLLDPPVVMRPRRPLPAPLALRLHLRLGKLLRDFNRVFAYVMAHGEDPPPRRKPAPRPDSAATQAAEGAQREAQAACEGSHPAVPAAAGQPESSPPRPARGPRLPGHAGWLAAVSAHISVHRSQLQYLLASPDALDVLPRSPALMRLLHPLCRILGVALPAELLPLLPPKPKRPPRAPRPRKRRWTPPRRADLHFILRMGKPIEES